MIDLLKAILEFLGNILSWFIDFVEWCVTKVFLLVLDGVIYLLGLIPVPDWLTGLSTNISSIDPAIMYFASSLQLGTGLAWIVSAYTIRFLIRRLPVVG